MGSEIFAQDQFDRFQRLNLRQLLGVGARAVLAHSQVLQLFSGLGYMPEWERIDVLPGAQDSSSRFAHRLNSYVSAHLDLGKGPGMSLVNTFYWQPKLTEFSDFRVLDEGELRFAVSRRLSFGIILTYAHQSRPPSGVVPGDLKLVNSMRLVL